MTQLDSTPSSLASSTASLSEPESACRLVVLVPDLEWDFIPAIHRIWELADAQHGHVLLLSLCNDSRQELGIRRALVILCTMLQDGRIPVETNVEIGTNWVEVVKRTYQMGDMIICFAKQRAGFIEKPLSQILESNLAIPIYVVSSVPVPGPKSNGLVHVIAWLGLIGIIAGFSVFQIKLMQVSAGWLQTILLILAAIAEFWLIWVWDSRFE